ncbi:MAG: Mannose 6 phosphate isomerase [Candidatus Uhrbacteria bacterium GW2011_GWA2_52_8d]|uniref:Mannose 6 phosphate isomerase n=1 Tax=Candidatus Uhrbacteria bacterium GW2011_GWA2_52_8d TaxID=1618979 RepID=A0A0G2ALE2_9BACT|nr:MAG: Mannose 6 phosphate isomerase [Candidatus Uhrbacteria bacterium GW2011_GWA2_52_8d]
MTDQLPENIRPWGFYEILETSPNHQVKRHVIHPGKRNSYQRHQRRTEYWIIVEGRCRATINDVFVDAGPGELISVPVGTKHRWENPNTSPLVLIEVQTGDYFGEDDIERFSDDYGREGTTRPH